MNEEKAREIAIRILDEFEELLAAKGIMVPSEDREGPDRWASPKFRQVGPSAPESAKAACADSAS